MWQREIISLKSYTRDTELYRQNFTELFQSQLLILSYKITFPILFTKLHQKQLRQSPFKSILQHKKPFHVTTDEGVHHSCFRTNFQHFQEVKFFRTHEVSSTKFCFDGQQNALNLVQANVTFPYPPEKIIECFSLVFIGCRKGKFTWNELNHLGVRATAVMKSYFHFEDNGGIIANLPPCLARKV